jgi:hypothetical protein
MLIAKCLTAEFSKNLNCAHPEGQVMITKTHERINDESCQFSLEPQTRIICAATWEFAGTWQRAIFVAS